MQKLVRGLHDFQANVFRDHKALFERLATGQQPEALFITCCDSRINPNLILQADPGELFIHRNIGNIVPPYGTSGGAEGATIEYAVGALNIADIIICGHTHCGAMQGLLAPDTLSRMPLVARWLEHAEATRRIIQEKYGEESSEEQLTDTVKENVLVQLEHLRTYPAVAVGMATGRIKLHGWVYAFETGKIYAYDPAMRKFEPIIGTFVPPSAV